jgi:hypothetical protein
LAPLEEISEKSGKDFMLMFCGEISPLIKKIFR